MLPQKTIKKDIQQLRTSFNFREPYQVIVDGNFLSACTTTKKDPYAAIHDILFGEIKLMTTYCVCVELRALGTDFVEIADEAKRMEKRRCTHTTPVSASECIKSIIGILNLFLSF